MGKDAVPKKKVVKGAAASTKTKAAPAASVGDDVMAVLRDFYRHMLRDTHVDVEMKRDRPTVFAWTHFIDRDWTEKFLIRKKEGKFTAHSFAALRPRLCALVNSIIDANNAHVVASNYHECPLTTEVVAEMMSVSVSNSGLLQVVMEYNYGAEHCWDFTKTFEPEDDAQREAYAKEKGTQSLLEYVS
jgi:hypothetical protein